MKNIDQEIVNLQEQIDSLREEKAKLQSLSPEIRVAEFLHSKLCVHNHTDGCGWYYHDWDNTPLDGTRQRYLDKAKRLLSEFQEEEIELFFELMD